MALGGTAMTLMIELAPDLEERLRRAAEARGMEAGEYARWLIQEQLPPEPGAGGPIPPADRAAAVRAAMGRFQSLRTSSDAYSHEKQEEIDWEDRN
jgi:hypothetical protein